MLLGVMNATSVPCRGERPQLKGRGIQRQSAGASERGLTTNTPFSSRMFLYVTDSTGPPYRDESPQTGVEQSIPGTSGTILFVHTPKLSISPHPPQAAGQLP